MTNEVWITGVGAVTPLGNDLPTVAENLFAGRSAVRSVNLFPGVEEESQLSATVEEIPVPPGEDTAEFRRLERMEQLGLSCASSALRSADWCQHRDGPRVGVVMGLGAEWLRAWEASDLGGGHLINDPHPQRAPIVRLIQRRLGLQGPAMTVAAACASANYALAQARRWMQLGLVDCCLAGGCDLLTPMAYAGFNNLRALSRCTGDPTEASRPFDIDRDGFVFGEGGAVFLLESGERARRRGAHPLAELAGFGATSDASHMIIPSSDPVPAADAVQTALRDARVNPDEVDYINAHATSTPVGDCAETRSLKLVFGDHVSRLPVSSSKSMTGHLLSGAAAVEALVCLAALKHQAIPPTINLHNPDPECDLCHVPHHARQQSLRVVASDSFGFGGSNTCVVLRKAA
jgi:3-oxoacyl-[acyl-carrier-protein] synthase II